MPKSTVSADGGAMPAEGLKTRRAALGLIAGAPALAILPAAAGVLSSSPADAAADAPLFTLLAQWRVAQEKHNAAVDRLEKLEESMEVPRPRALTPRPDDEALFGADETLRLPYWTETFGKRAATIISVVNAYDFASPSFIPLVERLEEILAARRKWDAARKAARGAPVYCDLERQLKEADAADADLRRAVADMPARTVQGLLAKLAATAAAFGTDSLEGETTFKDGERVTVDAVGVSILRDWARLAENRPHLSGGTAAAVVRALELAGA